MFGLSSEKLTATLLLFTLTLSSVEVSARREKKEVMQAPADPQDSSLTDWFIAPNTRWCGKGNTAGKYQDLGGASTADKCCRKHDHCKLSIPGLSSKWGLFNYRPFTLSHCSCDMRFRTCLKMANSVDSNMVGNLFFNLVTTECFILKGEETCVMHDPETSECLKTVKKRRAYIRHNKKY